MSSTWRLECSRALAERDEYEKADLDLFNSCKTFECNARYFRWSCSCFMNLQDTRLADRTAAAEAVHQHATVLGATSTASETPNPTGLAQIRLDLGDAQRSRADLQARLATCTEELERLRVGAKGDSKRISELSVERAGLATKVKDRDAELKGKAKLLEVGAYLSPPRNEASDDLLARRISKTRS